MASCLRLTGSFDRAIVQLREAIRLAPQSADAHADLADVLAASGRVDEAAREHELANRLRRPTDQPR